MLDSYSDIVVRGSHATAANIIIRAAPSPRNPQNRYPTAAQVALNILFGPGQKQYQEYLTGTLVAGGGGLTADSGVTVNDQSSGITQPYYS
mgnify:CR=1 FL=1